jgi:3-hydroxyisobutyrate dehydrogenase
MLLRLCPPTSLRVRALRRAFSASGADAAAVAFVGLGNMGAPLCARISAAGHAVTHFDMDDAANARHAAEHGSTAAASAAAAARALLLLPDNDAAAAAAPRARYVFTCLPNSALVQAVAASLLADPEAAAALRGATWVDCTSGDPAMSRALAQLLQASGGGGGGATLLDAAVSGGPAGAQAGTVTAMVGGDAADFEAARPVLESFAKNLVLCGPTGSGHAVKAVNNTLLAANLWTVAEGLTTLAKHGVDPAVAVAAINTSSGRSWVTQQRYVDQVLPRSFDYGFSQALIAKDVDVAMRMVESAGTAAPVLRLVREMVHVAKHELGGDADHTEMVRLLERWGGEGTEVSPRSSDN